LLVATDEPQPEVPSKAKAGSTFGRILRTVAWAVLIAFAVGFFIGTLLRREMERPVRYIGQNERGENLFRAAVDPGDIGYALPRVLMPRDHEEQVG
jgi:hypothetical protein